MKLRTLATVLAVALIALSWLPETFRAGGWVKTAHAAALAQSCCREGGFLVALAGLLCWHLFGNRAGSDH